MQPFREHLEAPAQSSFRCFARRARGFRFNWHCHRDYELTLIARGTGKRYVGDSVERYRGPDLVLVGPDLPHTWEAPTARPQSAIVVQFSPEWAQRLGGLPEWAPVRDLLERSRRGIAFRGPALATATRLLLRLPGWSPHERLAGLIGLLGSLSRAGDGARTLAGPGLPAPGAGTDRRFDAVRRFIAERAGGPLAQTAVARQAGMAAATFSRWFKRATGRTYVSYLQELRIANACRALVESERGITEIAYAAGFANLSHFNRCFRRLRGATPRDYRAGFRSRAAR